MAESFVPRSPLGWRNVRVMTDVWRVVGVVGLALIAAGVYLVLADQRPAGIALLIAGGVLGAAALAHTPTRDEGPNAS